MSSSLGETATSLSSPPEHRPAISTTAIPSSQPYRQDPWSLRFDDREVERLFIAYLHQKPIAMVFFGYWALAAGYLVFTLQEPGVGFEFNLTWFAIAALVQTFVFVGFRKFSEMRAELLFIERAFLWLSCAFITAADHYATLKHFQSCDFYPSIVIDDRKAFEDPQCRKWLNPMGAISAAILLLLGVCPFTWIVSLGVFMVALYSTIWLAVPPPDLVVQVGIYCAFAVIGMAFVAFVRYDQEQGQRMIFLEYHKLQLQRDELAQREKNLTVYCSMLLPRALLRRSAEAISASTVDVADNAAVILIGIHDFGVWCTKRQPVDVAGDVVDLQMAVRKAADQRGADYIGSMGDTTVYTAGLVRSVGRPGHTGCALVCTVLRREGKEIANALVPLRAAVHVGPLRGAFMGEYSVRYDVTGTAYRVAEEALLECPANRCVVSQGLLVAASTWFEPDTESEPFTLANHRFTAIAATDASGANSSDPSAGNTDVNTLSLEEFGALDFDGPLVPVLASSASRQHPTVTHMRNSSSHGEDDIAVDASMESSAGVDALRHELQRMQVGTVWCCFPRFLDDDLETAFVNERMAQLPHAASRMWFAYAAFILGVLVLLLVDLAEPMGAISAIMLLVAIGLSVVMGTLPRALGLDRMRRWFFVWSVTGIVLPLVVVYACALARPAAVGNDPKLYMVIGALVRSYCFASTRWLALTVPLVTLVGLGQYALPGAYFRTTFVIIMGLVVATVAAEREREIVHRENTRRRVESRLVLSKLRSVERLREGLLRGAVPAEVFALVKHHRLTGSLQTSSSAHVRDGVVMAVSAVSIYSPTASTEAVVKPDVPSVGIALLQLEAMLSESGSGLALSWILGDQALVVGPVVTSLNGGHPNVMNQRGERAVEGALTIGVKLCEEHVSSNAVSVLVDYDAVVHAIELGDFAQYRALGVTVTRMLTVLASADPSTLAGCLLTERVATLSEELGLLRGYQTTLQGPMKFRGVGMVRFAKVAVS